MLSILKYLTLERTTQLLAGNGKEGTAGLSNENRVKIFQVGVRSDTLKDFVA